MIAKALLLLIWVYQRTLSPDHGLTRVFFPHGACRFHPSCSQYAKECLRAYPVLIALKKSGSRLLRCHPWAEGGEDLP